MKARIATWVVLLRSNDWIAKRANWLGVAVNQTAARRLWPLCRSPTSRGGPGARLHRSRRCAPRRRRPPARRNRHRAIGRMGEKRMRARESAGHGSATKPDDQRKDDCGRQNASQDNLNKREVDQTVLASLKDSASSSAIKATGSHRCIAELEVAWTTREPRSQSGGLERGPFFLTNAIEPLAGVPAALLSCEGCQRRLARSFISLHRAGLAIVVAI